ncbi:MAG: hypothetical protein ABJA35_04150 [Parafilimonas sp.]
MPNFTPEDLLLFQLGELEGVKSEVITEELSSNWALREKFNVLKEAFTRLNAMKLQSPRKQTVQNIMRYAMRKPVTV